MHKKTVFYVIISLLLPLIFASCSDDVVDNGTPVGTVFFSIDSLSVWLQPGTGNGINSQIFQQTISASKVKVEYTIQTNVDSTHSAAWVQDSSNGTPSHPVEQYYFRNVDSAVSYTVDIPAQPFYIKLEVKLNIYGSIIPHYIRLKNIKVTKQ